MRQEDFKNKVKWLCAKDFSTIGGQEALNLQERNFVPNYVRKDPSQPPAIHNFREKPDKSKFVSSKAFNVF